MVKIKVFISFLLILFIGCQAQITPKPAPIPQDTNKCIDAEVNLEHLQCKDRRGDPMWVNKTGERFQEICERAQREGVIFLNPDCVSKAITCEEANKCPVL